LGVNSHVKSPTVSYEFGRPLRLEDLYAAPRGMPTDRPELPISVEMTPGLTSIPFVLLSSPLPLLFSYFMLRLDILFAVDESHVYCETGTSIFVPRGMWYEV